MRRKRKAKSKVDAVMELFVNLLRRYMVSLILISIVYMLF